MNLFLALLPIALTLGLMAGLRWSAARSGAVGWLAALLAAWLAFGAGPELLLYAHLRAIVLAIDVLPIITGAYLLYRVTEEAGAVGALGRAISGLTTDRVMQGLLIGWVFASFLQGVGGFGVPVAVTAPLLLGLGFPPMMALVLPSIGHGWAVTLGSLGSAFQALMLTSGLPQETLAPPSSIYLGLACLMCGALLALAAGGWPALRRSAAMILITGITMAVVQGLIALTPAWNLAAAAAAPAGLAVYLLTRRRSGAERSTISASDLGIASLGYITLIIVLLGAQFISPIHELLGRAALHTSFPEMQTAAGYITPADPNRATQTLGHPGALLVYAALISMLLYQLTGKMSPGAGGRVVRSTLSAMIPAAIGILFTVSMATLMQYSGMTEALASALARTAGGLFPLVSPWIGALGAFMTGSNTNANVVFVPLQMRTAELLSLPAALIMAAQTSGAALFSVIAPAKLIVGVSTTGAAGREGDMLRAVLPYTLGLMIFISLISAAAVWLNGL